MTFIFKGEERTDAYSTPFFLFYCVAIRSNNEFLRLIAPCQKETTTHAKHHPTEDSRFNIVSQRQNFQSLN